jgi:alpha-D-ribose 1-methylphosphonate 5-triphosphate synthase subunit PhnG
MFQTTDKHRPSNNNQRAERMALFARAPVALLESGLGEFVQLSPVWLRAPETGLLMVQGRVGGDGQRFNVGEVTVTRCVLRLSADVRIDEKIVGVSYVLGRSHRQAQLAAIADALCQDEAIASKLQLTLLDPIAAQLNASKSVRAEKTATTKVDFFTVAREAKSQASSESEQS